jgi:hypothetical protein
MLVVCTKSEVLGTGGLLLAPMTVQRFVSEAGH